MAKLEQEDLQKCPVTACLHVIGGRWKPILIDLVSMGCDRFRALGRAVPYISKQMLTRQPRELEADGVMSRTVFAEVPPRVEYALTKRGKTLLPIFHAMRDWGQGQLERARK